MPQMRVGATLQPVWVRTATIVTGTTSTFESNLHGMLDRTLKAARAALDEQQIANMFVAFLTPASLIALVLGLWRLTADVGWTEAFVISSGFFSHWQVWIALAIALKSLATWGAAGRTRAPKNI
ncbi:MAG: hypothetical protein ABSB86_03880 [Bryobacteraceae bacterium]|jgi:hypothetical protein